jgi:replicative DNA helicase
MPPDPRLPANIDAEKFVLGAIFLSDGLYASAAARLEADDFSLEKHKRIWLRMGELQDRGERIDRATVAEELHRLGQLESCDGLAYLLSLEDGLPRTSNIDAYVRIVREKADLRRVIFRAQKAIEAAQEQSERASNIAAGAAEELLRLGASPDHGKPRDFASFVDAYPGGINGLLDPAVRKLGVPTGFTKLDNITGGLREGELIVVAGRPGMGKTALAMNIAQHVAVDMRPAVPALIFSLEMSAESLWTRVLCGMARVNQQRFRAGFLNSDERRALIAAASKLAGAPILIDDTAKTVMDVWTKSRQAKAEHRIGLVIVDYLQLLAAGTRHENRVQEVSAISRALKLLSKEVGTPIVTLSQLSRACELREDKRPQLSDLRESGSIEQDSDIVGFVYRPEVYEPKRADLRGQAELIVSKHRNGPVGRIPLVFVHEYTKFENAASESVDPPPDWHNEADDE